MEIDLVSYGEEKKRRHREEGVGVLTGAAQTWSEYLRSEQGDCGGN
jgi:hypothetical protein